MILSVTLKMLSAKRHDQNALYEPQFIQVS
jgi:hypothetical protein